MTTAINGIPTITLNNGIKMPQLGLGVWKAQDGDEVEAAVSAALQAGYRMIDTAMIYDNEAGVGKAIAASGIPREEIFVTTKLWNSDQGYESTLAAFENSRKLLGLDYIDLYLIHWPLPSNDTAADTWRAFEKLYADKRVRAIGVSNFDAKHLEHLMETATVTPAVNQIELHPLFQQTDTRAYCHDHGIIVESWSPIGGSKGDLLKNPTIGAIADTYNKSPAQIVIRWHVQSGLIVIPKSTNPGRIAENCDVFDFELNSDDMQTIRDMDAGVRMGPDPDSF